MGPWHCLVVEGLLGFDAENGEIKIPRFDPDKRLNVRDSNQEKEHEIHGNESIWRS